MQTKISEYIIHKLKNDDSIPFDLLLVADETKEAIEKYIYQSTIYSAFINECLTPVGVFALFKINDEQIEIKNIGVLELYQCRGIGSFLIEKIKEIAEENSYREIIVGTPDTGIKQIKFYEKNGFKKFAIKKNFFPKNYANTIIEDGVILKDMVMLKMQC